MTLEAGGHDPGMSFVYQDAYLVSHPSTASPLGVVRRDGAFWRYLTLADGPQSNQVFETREAEANALAKAAGAYGR